MVVQLKNITWSETTVFTWVQLTKLTILMHSFLVKRKVLFILEHTLTYIAWNIFPGGVLSLGTHTWHCWRYIMMHSNMFLQTFFSFKFLFTGGAIKLGWTSGISWKVLSLHFIRTIRILLATEKIAYHMSTNCTSMLSSFVHKEQFKYNFFAPALNKEFSSWFSSAEYSSRTSSLPPWSFLPIRALYNWIHSWALHTHTLPQFHIQIILDLPASLPARRFRIHILFIQIPAPTGPT